MASDQNDAVFPDEELDQDDDESREDEEEDDDNDNILPEPDDDEETYPSPSTPAAVPVSSGKNAPIPTAATTTIVVSDDAKRHRDDQIVEKKPLDDSRRLFQRLWTDEDEIGLLRGFLEYTTQRGSSHHKDTALFYDQIKSKLQLGFNKNQLVEKLRRLKKKYRNVLNKINSGKEFSFKSPHDQATFQISCKIWSKTPPVAGAAEENSFDDDETNPSTNPTFSHLMSRTPPPRKRSRSRSGTRTEEKRELNDGSASNRDNNYISNNNNDNNYNDDDNNNNNNRNSNSNNNNCNCRRSIQGLIKDTVRDCLSPILKEIQSSGRGMGSPYGFGARGFDVGGFTFNPYPYPMSLNLKWGSGEMVDEKWRKQQILELEVHSKRLKLVQDETNAALDELRSAGAGQGF